MLMNEAVGGKGQVGQGFCTGTCTHRENRLGIVEWNCSKKRGVVNESSIFLEGAWYDIGFGGENRGLAP